MVKLSKVLVDNFYGVWRDLCWEHVHILLGAAPWHGAGKEDAPAINLDLCYVVKFVVISLLVVLSLLSFPCLLSLILLLC